MKNVGLLAQRVTAGGVPVRQRWTACHVEWLFLLPDNHIGIVGYDSTKMMNKMWRGNRLWAVAPAKGIGIGLFRPKRERWHQQDQQTARA
ncbi:hypothetical protein D3C80_1281820 [compost metagenome]